MMKRDRTDLARALLRCRLPQRAEALVRAAGGLADDEATRLLEPEFARAIKGSLHRAATVVRAAHALAKVGRSPFQKATRLRMQGVLEHLRGETRSARSRLERAARVYAAGGFLLECGDANRVLVDVFMHLGADASARAAARRARSLYRRAGASDPRRLGGLAMNLGNIHHRRDEHRQALASYALARRLFARAGDVTRAASAEFNRANVLSTLDRTTESRTLYVRAAAVFRDGGFARLEAQAEYALAGLDLLENRLDQCLARLDAVRVRLSSLGDRTGEAHAHLDAAEAFLRANRASEARRSARRAVAYFRRAGYDAEVASCWSVLAGAELRDGRPGAAVRLFERAAELQRRSGNKVGAALSRVGAAQSLARAGRHVEACRTAERAARVLRAARLGSREARALAVGAAAALAADRPSRALVWARRAERLARGASDPRIELSALLVQAALEDRAGRVDAAFRRLIAAERCVERLRRGVTAEESRLAFAVDKSEVYEALVSNRLRVGSRRAVRQALCYAERGKSRALAERLSGATDPGADWQTPAAKALTERLRRLERDLATAEARLESGEGTPGLRAARSVRIAGLTSTRAGILERLRREDPLGASLLGGRPPDPRAVLDALGPDDVVLEYAQSDGQFHRFVAHDGRIEAQAAVARVDEVHPIVERIRFLLGKGVLGEAHAARFGPFITGALRGHFERLHALLVGDAATLFDGKTVRIIPHGVLHGLPFHALEADGRALVDRCVISYAPSLAVLGLIQSRDRRRGDLPVVLGVPDAAAPAIEDEVEAVGRALGGVRVFRGVEATVDALRRCARPPEVVHVACHGFFGADGPWQGGLRLGDAWFSLDDVYALRGTGNLVVLSGCETGRGIVYSGDEWVGLVRGFLQAGARAVVAATWELHDQAAATFMRDFYRGLGNRLGVAEALTRAQRIARRSDPLPLRWAPFQVFGDPHLTLNLRKAA